MIKKCINFFIEKISNRRFLLLLLSVALVVRLVYILTLEDKWYFYDTVHYDTAAQSLLNGEGFGKSLHFFTLYSQYCLEPLYPLFLSFIYFIFGRNFLIVRIIQALISVATVFLLYKSAKELGNEKTARWTAIIASFYPFYIFLSGVLYVTQLGCFFLLAAFYGFVRFSKTASKKWLLFASCFYALTLHTQPVLFPSVLLFVLWILFYRKRKWKRAVIDIFLFGSVLFVLLVPWTVRNYIVFKQITPMRACLGREGEIVNSIKIKFERNKVMTQNVFAHNKIGFYTYIENKRMMIDCFVDDSYFLTIGTRQEPDSLLPYFGLVFNGDEAHYVKSFSASLRQITGNDTVYTPVVQSGKSMGAFTATDQIFLEDTKILVKKSDEKWNNRIVFNTSNKTNFYEIVFPNDISPANVRRVGVLFSLNKADLSTNGYMVWLHPWLEPDLWIFKDGMPSNSVYIKKIVKGQNQSGFSSIVQLVVNHPVEFFRDHFIPEFFKFWSPYIDRIFTTSNEPSLQIQVVSFISLLPLLIFAPIGLFRQKNINIIILILIPVLTTSIGYSIFETQVRYRLVLDGFLILLAIPGFECFLQLFRKNFRD